MSSQPQYFKCASFVEGVEVMAIPWIESWAHRVVNHCFHQSLLQFAAQDVPGSSLLPPSPPTCSVPSHHDATLPWQAREHLPEGDFTVPITLTTAQIKSCHLNHKQQSNRTRELRVIEKERRAGRENMYKLWKQSAMHGLGKCRETAWLEGGVRSQKELGLSSAFLLTEDATLGKLLSLILFSYL